MKYRNIFLLTLSLLLSLTVHAQKLTVEGMTASSVDLSASTYERKDLAKNPCALVKVQLAAYGAKFEGNVVGDVAYKTGEYWVYMTEGSRELRIKHPNYLPLHIIFSDYGINTGVKAKQTYNLVVVKPAAYAANDDDDGTSYLIMTVTPKNSIVFIDDTLRTVNDGTMRIRLSYGQHRYRVDANGYATEQGTVDIGPGRKDMNIALQSRMSTLSVNCVTPGVQIYVNDQLKGTAPWSGQLPPGTYMVEGRKQGSHPQRETVSLSGQADRTVTLPALIAQVGRLDIDYQPVNVEVYLDGNLLGKSPDIFRNISVGSHEVELRYTGYTSKKERVTIEEGKTAKLVGSLSRIPSENAEIEGKGEYNRAYNLYEAKKYDEAFPIFLNLGESGYENSYGYLGLFYELGYGVTKDEQKAIFWYEKAFITTSQNWASYRYGEIMYKKGNFEKALKCYIKGSVRSGFAEESAYKAGKMYEKGEGTNVDIEKAVEYYRLSVQSAHTSFSRAANDLKRLGYSVMTEELIQSTKTWTERSAYLAGQAYEKGDGVEKNMGKAINMYREAAKHVLGPLAYSDTGRALARLGCGLLPVDKFNNVQISTSGQTAEQLYNKGKDLERSILTRTNMDNYPKAYAYYMAAARLGNIDAILRLGEIYSGTPEYPFKDLSTAIGYYKQIVDKTSTACYNLGKIYNNSEGYKDITQAIYYFKKGCSFGDNDGCPLWLGNLYEEQGNFSEALKYYELSANTPPKNQGWAMYKAGEYYEHGKGCVKDIQKAIDWYKRSAKTNNLYAQNSKQALDRLGVNY